jgi:hypothetical protein
MVCHHAIAAMLSLLVCLLLSRTAVVFAATDVVATSISTPALARDGSGHGGSSGQASSGPNSSGANASGPGSGSPGLAGLNAVGEGASGSHARGQDESGMPGSDRNRRKGHEADDHGMDNISLGDHDIARDAVMRGTAPPLPKVLPTVRTAINGDLLDIELRRLTSGVLVYDVTLLSSAGEFRSIVADAKRNRIIEAGQR